MNTLKRLIHIEIPNISFMLNAFRIEKKYTNLMKYHIIATLIFTSVFISNIQAQSPSPAPPQSMPILLKGGTVHVGNGEVIEQGIVTFEKGILTYAGVADNFNAESTAYNEIDVSGKHVYPGLILVNSILGLSEIGAVNATNDYNETGKFNPNVRAMVAYNTDSEKIPNHRSNGILISQIVPRGGTVSGTSCVMQLDAWNWEDAVVRADEGIHLFWPGKFRAPKREKGETQPQENEVYSKTVLAIEKNMIDASTYANEKNQHINNQKLSAIAKIFTGSSTLYIHVNKAAEIIKSIQLVQKWGVKKIVLVGASDAYYVKDFIKENNIPVILKTTHRLPSRPEEEVSFPFRLPYLLQQSDIKVTIDGGNAMNTANLPFLAGTAAAYGLPKEEALKMITLNPAQTLGIADRLGSVEVGKDATIIVSTGDILDMKTSTIEYAFISGRQIDLDNKQKKLYKKYSDKYN